MRLASLVRNVWRLLRQRHATVALMAALSTPVLIGATGFAVDVGYWYQQQESAQSAADAAALSAAMNSDTTTTDAAAAADTATKGQFGFAAGTGGASIALNVVAGTASSSTTTYTATATIPRGSFFSKNLGPLLGIGAGFQHASSTAVNVAKAATASQSCIYTTGGSGNDIFATGGAKVTATNCGIYANSTSCIGGDSDAIAAEPSASITGSGITTAGCVYANTTGGAYVGGPNSNTSVVSQHATAQADPLAALGNPPTSWPAMPAMATQPGMPSTPAFVTSNAPANLSYTNVGQNLGYNTWSSPGYGDCTYQGSYSANCEVLPNAISGMANLNLASLLLNEGTSTGTTYISGGFGGNINNGVTMNGSTYYINGGVSLSSNNTVNMNGTYDYVTGNAGYSGNSYNIAATNYSGSGPTTFNNAAVSFAGGAYYLYGNADTNNNASAVGLTVNQGSLTAGAGNYYLNGGLSSSGNTSFGAGTDYFVGTASTSGVSGSAISATSGFSLGASGTGTYYMNGEASFSGATTFGAGTYTMRGATSSGAVTSVALNDTANASFSGSGGTYYINGGANMANPPTTFGAGTYYFTGTSNSGGINGVALTVSASSLSIGAGTTYLDGGLAITNAATTLGAGTFYIRGTTNGSSVVNGYAMTFNASSFSTGAGTYYFNGGVSLNGNPNMTFGQGLYLFSKYSGSNAAGVLDNSNSNTTIVFTGGTYFFDGGFTVGANTNVTFGPGIYYVRGGNLAFTAGSKVTANGATFVLEGTASYQMNGGSQALNLSAPTTNCVQPASYPLAAYTLPASNPPATPNSYAPYDGTNGRRHLRHSHLPAARRHHRRQHRRRCQQHDHRHHLRQGRIVDRHRRRQHLVVGGQRRGAGPGLHPEHAVAYRQRHHQRLGDTRLRQHSPHDQILAKLPHQLALSP